MCSRLTKISCVFLYIRSKLLPNMNILWFFFINSTQLFKKKFANSLVSIGQMAFHQLMPPPVKLLLPFVSYCPKRWPLGNWEPESRRQERLLPYVHIWIGWKSTLLAWDSNLQPTEMVIFTMSELAWTAQTMQVLENRINISIPWVRFFFKALKFFNAQMFCSVRWS